MCPVRPGGHAYEAGMHTGDVIDNLDGRPHTYGVERGGVGGPEGRVILGEPSTG
jgi:hypothetical protein